MGQNVMFVFIPSECFIGGKALIFIGDHRKIKSRIILDFICATAYISFSSGTNR